MCWRRCGEGVGGEERKIEKGRGQVREERGECFGSLSFHLQLESLL